MVPKRACSAGPSARGFGLRFLLACAVTFVLAMLRPHATPTVMRLSLLLLSSLMACGPSASQIRRAKTVEYKTEFANVWNAVVESVRAEYPRLKIEDAINGMVLTEWHVVERTDATEDDPTLPTGTKGGKFFRIFVELKGGPKGPWVVVIDGEAAEHKVNMAMLIPFKHGAPDEPTWVQPRIDKIYVRVYDRLEKYAVARKGPPPVKPKQIDRSPWRVLPADAADLIARVHDAAKAKDAALLRPLMAAEFTWSLGAAPSADQAIAVLSADPTLLAALQQVLEAKCASAGEGKISCPGVPEPTAWRAEFAHVGGRWQFVGFYEGE